MRDFAVVDEVSGAGRAPRLAAAIVLGVLLVGASSATPTAAPSEPGLTTQVAASIRSAPTSTIGPNPAPTAAPATSPTASPSSSPFVADQLPFSAEALAAYLSTVTNILPWFLLAVALSIVGASIRPRAIQARVPALQPDRMRLAKLYEDTAELRAGLRAACKAGEVVKSDWDQQISVLERRIRADLAEIMPDDWRRIRDNLGASSSTVDATNPANDLAWANVMLEFLLRRRTLLEELLKRHTPDD